MPKLSDALFNKIKERQIACIMSYMQEQLNLFIVPNGRTIEEEKEPKDLFILADEFRLDVEENNLLITGASGAGKTFFGLIYIQRLWGNYMDGEPIPLWIPLLSIDNPSYHLLYKHFQYNLKLSADEFEEFCASKIPLLIVLDGYDELNSKINLHQTNQFDTLALGTKIITACRYEALNLISDDYKRCFISNVANQHLCTIEILPFDNRLEEDAPIGCYIKKFLQHPPEDIELPQPAWTVKTYLDHLKCLPEIHDLLSNPYILGRVVEELPAIVKACQSESNASRRLVLTRYRLYELFTQRWFKRQADKYRRAGHPASQLEGKYKDKTGKVLTLEELFASYTRRLAKAMFHRRVKVIEYSPPKEQEKPRGSLASEPAPAPDWSAKYLADELDLNLPLLRAGCPLLRLGPRSYKFLHGSLAEFFSAQHLFNGALVEAWVIGGSNLNKSNLQLEPEVLQHLVDQAKTNPEFEQALWGIIEISKSEPTTWRASANAGTIIARAKNFIEANLRRARLGGEEGKEKWGADLSHTWMDNADASDADLRHCNFEGTSTVGLKLQGACLDGIRFGELPFLRGDRIHCSPDVKLIASIHKDNDFFSFSISAEADYSLTVYSLNSERAIKSFSLTKGNKFSPYGGDMRFSPDNKYLIMTDISVGHMLLEIATGKFLEIKPYNERPNHFVYLGNSILAMLIRSLKGGGFVLLDLHKKEFRSYEQENGEFIEYSGLKDIQNKGKSKRYSCIASNPSGTQLALGSMIESGSPNEIDYAIVLWELSHPKKIRLLKGDHKNKITHITYHPNGMQLASCCKGDLLLFWDINSGKVLKKIEHAASITAIAFSPDGCQLASGSSDETIAIWKMPQGVLQHRFTSTDPVSFLFYHPHEAQLISEGGRTIRFWDISSNNVLSVHNRTNAELFHRGVFSPDGLLAACVSSDHVIHIWDVVKRKLQCILKDHSSQVYLLAFRFDNLELASSHKGIIYVWDLKEQSIKYKIDISTLFSRLILSKHNIENLTYVSRSSQLRALVYVEQNEVGQNKYEFFCCDTNESVQRSVSYQIPGLKYQEVPGDGHCLFHAVGLHVNQDQAYLRRIVAAHLEHNKNDFRTFIPEGRTIENYIRAIREGEEWADHIEIEVLMRVLDRPVIVIGPDRIIRNREVLERGLRGEPIFVLYKAIIIMMHF